MADVIDMSASNLNLNRSPSGGDECSPSAGNHEEPNPNTRSSSSSHHPPPPPNSRPDLFLPDWDQERDKERDRDLHSDEDLYRSRPSHSPSPLPYSLREHRLSPPLPRASPTYIPPLYYNKRSRRDDGGFDRRTGSPREDGRYGCEIGRGRGGFGDEQTLFSYYSLDWSDAGFGGEGLMTYKPFIQVHGDDILPTEAERWYQEYRNEFIAIQKRAYFDLHKEDWLKEKFHPTNLVSAVEKRNEQAKSNAKEFLSDLQNGRLDIGSEKVLTKPAEKSDTNSDESVSGGKRRRLDESGSDWVKRLDSHWKERMNGQDPLMVLSAIEKIEDMSGEVLDPLTRKIRDDKYGWKYGCGAKGCHKSFHAPEFVHKHLKLKHPELVVELTDKMREDIYHHNYMNDSNAGFGSVGSGLDWVMSLDSHWEETINCQDPLVVLSAKDKIEAVSGEVLDPLTRKIRDEKYEWKYGCGAEGCTKLFHAPEFVHKHLKRKHPEVVVELTAKLREEIYHQNYMNDPNAHGGTPAMQLPATDRMRRRPPLANRLRDERGGPRMDEGRGNKSRAEGSPTCEGDEAEAKRGDDPIIDAFGGRGPHGGGAPFLHEFIPLSPSIRWRTFPSVGHQTNHHRLNVDFVLSL